MVLGRDTIVLVTGAGGGVGTHIVRVLLQHGIRVRATDMGVFDDVYWRHEPWANSPLLEWMSADLTTAGPVQSLVCGCTAVVHAAARVNLTDQAQVLEPINVDAVAELVIAAQDAGVARFVHISCGSLRKELPDQDQGLALDDAYERSKFMAEEILTCGDASTLPDWTILRPALVYGPYCRTMSAGLMTLPPILHAILRYLPGLRGGLRTSFCHVEDVAHSVLFVLEEERTVGQVFDLADGEPLGLGEVFTAMTQAYGFDVGPLFPIPVSMTRGWLVPLIDRDIVFDTLRDALSQMWKRVMRAHGLTSPLRPLIERKALLYAAHEAQIDASKLRDLGWEPRWTSFQEGVLGTVRWYQQMGWAPRYDSAARLALERRAHDSGFAFNEVLRGTWHDAQHEPEDAIFDLEVSFASNFSMCMRGDIDGTVFLHGITGSPVPCKGTLTCDVPALHMVYEFGFVTAHGRVHRFWGEKRWDISEPLASLERLEGVVVDDKGARLGQVCMIFDLGEQIVPFLWSMRFLWPWNVHVDKELA